MTNALSGIFDYLRLKLQSKPGLAVLLALHSAASCMSLIKVADYQTHISYSDERLWYAVAVALVFSSVSLLFLVARFSFGYFVGFYLYTMILGFLWIDVFSKYNYDHTLAGLSAAISLVFLLIPALFVAAPFRHGFALSPRNFERLLNCILGISVATIAIASFYNFKLVSVSHIYDFRNQLAFPGVIRYLIGITSSTLLPFALACYWLLKRRWHAGAVLVILLLYYPVTLTKFALFAPAWLVTLAILTRFFDGKTSAILSLFVPIALGAILIHVSAIPTNIDNTYFDRVNIRMIATPSSALDIYNDYFASHPFTYFCHVSILKPLMHCPYQDPLSIVMERVYKLGNLNASLFATEGVASVGLYFAPLTALAAGLVLALGNRASAGLPARFVLMSSGLLPHVLLNVPLTVALLTHGTALLFLLWYVMPRSIFEQKP
jgi:hypothetical protein